ncbi:hypothetical protein HY498_03410 [Candidatus Woesearchaeota archaeon]|nr:hypothetical protein [Candidatus Woesearchaeota archaeon]
MERKLSTNRYIAAFFITLIVFSLGFIIGIFVDKLRANYVTSVLDQQKVESDSLQLQYLYLITQNITENCPAIKSILNSNLKSLEKSLGRLTNYKDRALYKLEEFDLNRRQYALEEIKYWTLSDKIKLSCNEDFVRVLFFFTADCDECDSQGFILDYYKKVLQDKLLIFSFDSRLAEQEPLVKTLLFQFNITQYPALIIENKKFEGLKEKEDIKNIICPYYKEKSEIC